jgi:hypothetical protein
MNICYIDLKIELFSRKKNLINGGVYYCFIP